MSDAVIEKAPANGSSNGQGRSSLTHDVGSSGLVRMNGFVFEEFLPALQGAKAIQVFKEMRDNDPIIGALLFAIDKLLRSVKWTATPSGNAPEDIAAAKFLDECMHDMSMTWADVISEVASMFVFGWSWLELVYKKRDGQQDESDAEDAPASSKYDDGRWGWRRMPLRAQETLVRWIFDNNGAVKGMVQRAAPDYEEVPIPMIKSLLFRTTSHKGNPEGRSILRNAYRPWFFKKMTEEIEGIGIARDLAGFPIMWVDPKIMEDNATAEEKRIYEMYKNIVRNIRRDQQEGLVMPNLRDANGNRIYELELMTSGGARTFDTDKIITRYDQRMAMVVLADFILLGHDNVGSWALSSDKTNLFSVALGAWLDSIAAVFNDYAVARLFRLNGMKLKDLPKITYGDIETPDLAALGAYITALAGAGMPLFPNEGLMKRLLEVAHLPPPEEDEEPIVQPTDIPADEGNEDSFTGRSTIEGKDEDQMRDRDRPDPNSIRQRIPTRPVRVN